MKNIIIAGKENIHNIVQLRVEQQLEDWGKTIGNDYSKYADDFSEITRKHLEDKLNKSIYFSIMLIDDIPVAMCALEELSELPQITICGEDTGRHGWLASAYTRPEYRGNGYQQEVIRYLLEFAKKQNFKEITLTTNTLDAKHIYEKFGFKRISDKYFMEL